jgi:hypothetical protein
MITGYYPGRHTKASLFHEQKRKDILMRMPLKNTFSAHIFSTFQIPYHHQGQPRLIVEAGL